METPELRSNELSRMVGLVQAKLGEHRSLAHVERWSERERLSRELLGPFERFSDDGISDVVIDWMDDAERSALEVLTLVAALISAGRYPPAVVTLEMVYERVTRDFITSRGYPDKKIVWWAHVIIDRIGFLTSQEKNLNKITRTIKRSVDSALEKQAT